MDLQNKHKDQNQTSMEGREYDKKHREKEIEHQKGIIAKLKDLNKIKINIIIFYSPTTFSHFQPVKISVVGNCADDVFKILKFFFMFLKNHVVVVNCLTYIRSIKCSIGKVFRIKPPICMRVP